MDVKKIASFFRKESKNRKLNKKEINNLISLIIASFDGSVEMIVMVNLQLRDKINLLLTDFKLHECFIGIFTDNILAAWKNKTMEHKIHIDTENIEISKQSIDLLDDIFNRELFYTHVQKMDSSKIMSLFTKGSQERKLNEIELLYLKSLIEIPYDGIKEVRDLMNKRFRKIVHFYVKNIKIRECFIPLYISRIYNTWILSLVDPGTAIGPITSDAIGQQATQALLNTFHSAGSAKSGGPDGIRENISISQNRKVLYSVVNFKNKNMKIEDVMKMRSKYINITLNDISISILPLMVDVNYHKQLPENFLPRNEKAGRDLFERDIFWWYYRTNFVNIYTGHPRHAIRIQLDVMKLYEFDLNTTIIANKLSSKTWKFKDTDEFITVAIPSPTYLGIIDVYISSKGKPNIGDLERDYILQAAYGLGDFNTFEVSGVSGIKNFYAMSTPVTSVIRDVKLTEDNRGTWVYFNDLRFLNVPINKFYELCKAAELEIDISQTQDLEYISHKIKKENRKTIEIKTVSFGGDSNYIPTHELSISPENGNINFAETNPFFTVTDSSKMTFSCPSVYLKKEPYVINTNKGIYFENEKDLKSVIIGIMSGDLNICRKIIDPSIFLNNGISHNIVSIPIEVGVKKLKYFIWACKFHQQTFVIDVNLDYVNSKFNVTSLDDAIISHFGFRNYSLPEAIRLPKMQTLKEIDDDNEEITPRLLIKSTVFFRDVFDPIDKKTGLKIKIDPIDRLKNFLNNNVDDIVLKEYAYGETQGSSLIDLLSDPSVDYRTTYCNDFYQTFGIFGIEGLRNLLGFDLISIINSQGDINVKYPVITADIITSNGINPMTSQGVTSQQNGVLSTITFDNVKKYITKAAFSGKFESTDAVSTSIFIGNPVNLGTGYADIKFDSISLSPGIKSRKTIKTLIKDFSVNEDSEESKAKANVSIGKFPKVVWVFDNFIKKDVMFYMNMGISKYSSQTLIDVKPLSLSFINSKISNLLVKL